MYMMMMMMMMMIDGLTVTIKSILLHTSQLELSGQVRLCNKVCVSVN